MPKIQTPNWGAQQTTNVLDEQYREHSQINIIEKIEKKNPTYEPSCKIYTKYGKKNRNDSLLDLKNHSQTKTSWVRKKTTQNFSLKNSGSRPEIETV